MNENQFRASIVIIAIGFTALFSGLVTPALMQDRDLLGAFAAGFVNPYASGYSADAIACWLVLAAWVAFEARSNQVEHGWICLLVGVVPGVAVGFAGYLLVRAGQLGSGSEAPRPVATS